MGSGSGRLRLGGRARQLPERAHVRARRRSSSVLAGAAPARRRTSSASTASTGRRCCSRPATSCRSSCSCTATSTSTTGRSRSRSATCSTRSTWSTSTASIRSVSGSRASSPFGQDGNVTLDSFRERYERELGERPRQPALADDGDDRPLPRRRPRAGARRERRARRCRARAARRRSRRPSTASTSPGRSTTIWDYVRASQPPRGADEAVGAREGSRPRRRARSGPLRARRRPADRRRRARGVPARDRGSGSSKPSGQPADVAWDSVAYGRTEAATGIEAGAAALPAHRRRPATAA